MYRTLYITDEDVSIPFKINDLTRSVNPLKLREMLAGGCPVVATALPEIQRYSDRVSVCETESSWITAIEALCSQGLSDEARRNLSKSVEQETWTSKANTILAAARTNSA